MHVQPSRFALADYASDATGAASTLNDLTDKNIVAAEGDDIRQMAHTQRLAGQLHSAALNIDTALKTRDLPRSPTERTHRPASPTTNPGNHTHTPPRQGHDTQHVNSPSTPAACASGRQEER